MPEPLFPYCRHPPQGVNASVAAGGIESLCDHSPRQQAVTHREDPENWRHQVPVAAVLRIIIPDPFRLRSESRARTAAERSFPMKLFTEAQRRELLANGQRSAAGDQIDPLPVVKLFTPDAGAT